MKWFFPVFLICLLNGCTSNPHDLEAPCHNFGRHCLQYPINEDSEIKL